MRVTYLFAKFMKKIQIPAVRNCKIHKSAKVCSGSNLVNSSLGAYSYVGNYCTVVGAKIGKFCSIADNCVIGGAQHPYKWVSTSPAFIKGKNCMGVNLGENEYRASRESRIGNDVWIGDHCLIKGGVTIGDGAVIGMGAVVTKDVGPYEVWGGGTSQVNFKKI
ncbi:MAG: CatB-related O-acetyltransferase [Lachnospiraceae bacterium]|nr:CatB-related O-acetyltransferase [Lachnospiraceae bacterium]